MTYWAYLTAPIRPHTTKQVLDASASRARECVQIAPGTKPKPAEVASGIHDVEPTVMVYLSAVRDPDLLITSGQLPIEGPFCGAHAVADRSSVRRGGEVGRTELTSVATPINSGRWDGISRVGRRRLGSRRRTPNLSVATSGL